MPSRDDVLVQRNAISSVDLRHLVDHVQHAHRTDSLVSNFDDAVDAEWVVNRAIRDTQEIELPDLIRRLLARIDEESIRAFINPFYNVHVGDREPSQILHYGVGGHYIPHVDSETLYKDDGGLELWEKTLDRDLSFVYFLNDDFDGGELFFPALDLVIQPEEGMLVCFPSDHNFIHGVHPVITGHRYTIVTWARVVGTPSMDEINQSTMDEYHRMFPTQIEQRSRLGRGGRSTS
jgi:predicted 2-oxoglutarate/Fe(II)-dependent dioxygenase YbiX